MCRLTLLITTVILCSVNTYKILGIFPHPGKSHFDVFAPLFKTLSKRGHQVTVISHFPLETKIPNYTDISLVGTANILINVVPLGRFKNKRSFQYLHVLDLAYFNEVCENGFKSEELEKFISSKPKFDIVMTELFTTNCFLGLLDVTGGSLIGLTSTVILPWTPDYLGLPDNPSYIPSALMAFGDRMSFLERVENSIVYVLHRILYKILIDIPANDKAREKFGKDLPDLDVFLYNTSLVLNNVYSVLHRPRALVPGVIEVGGMFIGERKPLEKNIEKWIKESPHGVIYFSMGSMIKGDTFPEEKRRAFLRAFGRLEQRVLWKWENDTMPEKPDNVMIQKWMPQFDILCHPNVKAFISHGGLLGTTEAVHCGVPAVVMPQYGDQFTNARALEASGGGIILDFTTATEEDVYNALKTVLDPSFNKKTKELSERFRDRPMSPLDTAVYWVEYVARHKGAHHLKTAAVGMPLYQYLLLDVIAFLSVILIVISYISFYITRAIFRKIFKKKDKVKKN